MWQNDLIVVPKCKRQANQRIGPLYGTQSALQVQKKADALISMNDLIDGDDTFSIEEDLVNLRGKSKTHVKAPS